MGQMEADVTVEKRAVTQGAKASESSPAVLVVSVSQDIVSGPQKNPEGTLTLGHESREASFSAVRCRARPTVLARGVVRSNRKNLLPNTSFPASFLLFVSACPQTRPKHLLCAGLAPRPKMGSQGGLSAELKDLSV